MKNTIDSLSLQINLLYLAQFPFDDYHVPIVQHHHLWANAFPNIGELLSALPVNMADHVARVGQKISQEDK